MKKYVTSLIFKSLQSFQEFCKQQKVEEKKKDLIMVFQCQRDSFQKEYKTKIVKIDEVGDNIEVSFEDTVFFPEGNNF